MDSTCSRPDAVNCGERSARNHAHPTESSFRAQSPRHTQRYFEEAWRAHNESGWADGIANVRDRLVAGGLPTDDESLKACRERSVQDRRSVFSSPWCSCTALDHSSPTEPISAPDTVTKAGS